VIRVAVANLAQLPVDAVLRPANALLDPVSPAASRLDADAGERFVSLRRVQVPLDVGAAVITGSGDLAAEFVLHVVIQSEERAADRDTVRRALVSAWQRASDWQLARVAAPLVGANAAGLSLETAAELLAQTFTERPAAPDYPAELHIVLERADEVPLVEAVIGSRA
jgi:O-acetyl-ADP-ribose deacetylase (regulator of RNase III)